MATRAEIIPALASLFDTLPNSVDVIDRELAAAGLRTRLPRGRGAGAVGPLDMVHLAFALTGRRAVRGAAQEVEEISSLPLSGGRCLRKEAVREYPDPIYVEDGAQLTQKGILEGHWSQRYPRDVLPMAPTYGESLAGVIERFPTIKGEFIVDTMVSWEPLRASITIRRGDLLYEVDFGVQEKPFEERPRFTFMYSNVFLSKLSRILHA
jgi:hypothetical protein